MRGICCRCSKVKMLHFSPEQTRCFQCLQEDSEYMKAYHKMLTDAVKGDEQ